MNERLVKIKKNWQYGLISTSDGDWLIEEVERLKTIEQAYEALKSAL